MACPRDPFSTVYNGIAAYAQFIGRNHDEAMRLAREGIRLRDDFVGDSPGCALPMSAVGQNAKSSG